MSDIVIVIDPGHGSMEYKGCEFGNYIEKDVDLFVAQIMKEQLSKFEGVKVYMTRENDVNVGLKERCDMAKALKADYFISIHFNASANHDIYGSEVWLPVQKNYYNKMYPIANEFVSTFEKMGFLNRGIKTRLSSNGKDNYYAVLKHTTNYGIPSCIVEHCHLDNINDTRFVSEPGTAGYLNALVNFGNEDALAVARALHLKSTELGLDYTGYKTVKGTAKSGIIKPDMTEPSINDIEFVNTENKNGEVKIKITACDKDSYIVYYSYSVNGGVTFSELYPWMRHKWNLSADSMEISIPINNVSNPSIVVRVYNSYDVYKDSNVLVLNNTSNNLVSSVKESNEDYKLVVEERREETQQVAYSNNTYYSQSQNGYLKQSVLVNTVFIEMILTFVGISVLISRLIGAKIAKTIK